MTNKKQPDKNAIANEEKNTVEVIKEDVVMTNEEKGFMEEDRDINMGFEEASAAEYLDTEVDSDTDTETEVVIEEDQKRDGPVQRDEAPRARRPRSGRRLNTAIPKNKTTKEMKELADEAARQHSEHTEEASGERERRYISRTGRLQVRTEANEKNESLLHLVASFKNNVVLQGQITSIEKLGTNNWSAVVMFGPFKVIIPAGEVMDFPEFESTRGYINELHMKQKMLEKRIGSFIDFIVRGDPDEANEVAIASRKDAMRKVSINAYIEPDQNGKTRIYEGAIVEARIVDVIQSGIHVEIHGVDTYINFRELSYSRIQDATKEGFIAGDHILVKILEIDKSDKNNIKVRASHKQALPNMQKKLARIMNKSSIHGGIVTNMSKSGVFVKLTNGAEALCAYPSHGNMPAIDCQVVVRISEIDYDTGRIMGNLTSVRLNAEKMMYR